MEVIVEKYVITHKYKNSHSPFHCRISCLNTMSFLLLNSHRLCQVPWAIHIASFKYSNMVWQKLHWNNSQDTLQKELSDIKNYKLVKHCSLSLIATSCVKAIKQILNDYQQDATILAYLFVPNQLYMFQAMSLPIIRSTWLYYSFWYCSPILLPAGVMDEMELLPSHRTISDAVNTVKCS